MKVQKIRAGYTQGYNSATKNKGKFVVSDRQFRKIRKEKSDAKNNNR